MEAEGPSNCVKSIGHPRDLGREARNSNPNEDGVSDVRIRWRTAEGALVMYGHEYRRKLRRNQKEKGEVVKEKRRHRQGEDR